MNNKSEDFSVSSTSFSKRELQFGRENNLLPWSAGSLLLFNPTRRAPTDSFFSSLVDGEPICKITCCILWLERWPADAWSSLCPFTQMKMLTQTGKSKMLTQKTYFLSFFLLGNFTEKWRRGGSDATFRTVTVLGTIVVFFFSFASRKTPICVFLGVVRKSHHTKPDRGTAPSTLKSSQDSLGMPNIRDGAVEGDAIADIDVEAILPVRLVDPVGVCHWKRFPLLTVTCTRRMNWWAQQHFHHLQTDWKTRVIFLIRAQKAEPTSMQTTSNICWAGSREPAAFKETWLKNGEGLNCL